MTNRTGKPSLENRLARRWRDWTWWSEASPYFGGRAIGALLAVGVVAPFIGATFLERALGDLPTVIILAGLGVVALAGGLVLLLRQRVLFTPLMLFAVCVACGVCVYITLAMNW
jgi:hypothetical protein